MRNELSISTLLIHLFFCVFLITSCATTPGKDPQREMWTFQNIPYASEDVQTLNIILPEKEGTASAIVYIHGGFYHSGDKLWYPLFLTDFSDRHVFATVGYRRINWAEENTVHIDDMISDIDNALSKIMAVSIENGVTITNFILVGHSAGGHLSLLYGYRYFHENNNRDIKIEAVVSLAGPADYTDDFGWSSMSSFGSNIERRLLTLSWLGTELAGHSMELTQYDWTAQDNSHEFIGYAESYSPVKYVNTGEIPPTLLVYALDDRVVPYSNAVKLAAALDKADIPHKLITVTGTGNNHMLGGVSVNSMSPIRYENQMWVNEVKEWMELFLK